MRLTKDNINEYLNKYGDLDLWGNKKITHIDYLPNGIEYINIRDSNIKEITCELPEGLETFYSYGSKLRLLPLLPKTLFTFDGVNSNLPKEFQVTIYHDKIQCNNLRKLQMINSI